MYRILYLGQDKNTYTRLRDGFPIHMHLEPEHERNRLKERLSVSKTHGIILPFHSPGLEDFGFLKRIIGTPNVPGVIVTASYMTAPQAVCCMRHGAFDCLVGPVNGEVMGACLNRMIRPEKRKNQTPERLIAGRSQVVEKLLDRLEKYSDLPYPVLITGETGSGKELAARTIHSQSNRRCGPFTAVNCASFPDDILGSELFGSRRGAFTGSVDRPGLFESSNGGTLFLDEIGELSIQGQACLLRIIEDGVVRRIGANTTRAVDVRVVAATNRDLRYSMKNGIFRSDLFYRLNLLGVTVPPLRKRREDIPDLSRNYLRKIRSDVHWRVESAAMALLVRHSWPGNVRELQSVLLRATLSAENGVLRAGDIAIW
jgi:DNA-binding NtrC family response regulator